MKKLDLILLCTIIFLTVFGLFMIYDASSVIAFRDFADKYHYIKEQCVNAILGFVALGFLTFFDYKRFYNLALIILIGAMVMLMGVFLPGIGIYALGAHRWINLGITVFQPAEFVKLSLAIYLAAWFSRKERGETAGFLYCFSVLFFCLSLLSLIWERPRLSFLKQLSFIFIRGQHHAIYRDVAGYRSWGIDSYLTCSLSLSAFDNLSSFRR